MCGAFSFIPTLACLPCAAWYLHEVRCPDFRDEPTREVHYVQDEARPARHRSHRGCRHRHRPDRRRQHRPGRPFAAVVTQNRGTVEYGPPFSFQTRLVRVLVFPTNPCHLVKEWYCTRSSFTPGAKEYRTWVSFHTTNRDCFLPASLPPSNSSTGSH